MRGKVWPGAGRHPQRRITPACAGKSSLTSGYIPARGDHPRVCGEKLCPLMGEGEARGSPPRVRGKALVFAGIVPVGRITPACAGKSFSENRLKNAIEDHPRVCGEKWLGNIRKRCKIGSPPRVRGKGFTICTPKPLSRITPACAGKSGSQGNGEMCSGDHPRVCGEKVLLKPHYNYSLGSPPRVRGKGPMAFCY